MKKIAFILALVLIVCSMFGCAATVTTEAPITETPTSVPTLTPVPEKVAVAGYTPAPTNSPVPSPTPDWISPAKAAFGSALNLDFSVYTDKLASIDLSVYATVVENVDSFKELTQEINDSVLLAVNTAAKNADGLLDSIEIESVSFTWKQIASLVRGFGPNAKQTLQNSIELAISNEGVFTVSVPEFDLIIASGSITEQMTSKFSLAYMNTLYDDNGIEKDFVSYALTDDYLATLSNPVPGNHMKDCWYQSRSKGTRRHTGMDITGRSKTPLLATTDGTVVYTGENDTCGNYIVIEDALGFEYHYYHLFEPSTLEVGAQVKQNDVVGLMGRTGNSDTVHLHIAIIAPDYSYLNPYEVYLKAGLTD